MRAFSSLRHCFDFASSCLSTRRFSSLVGAQRVAGFGPTVWAEFTPLAVQHKAVNLGQGFPDWECPEFVKEAVRTAVSSDRVQYTRSAGHPRLVRALANLYSPLTKRTIDENSEIVVGVGATGVGYATMQALVDPGDEVLVIEPYYDSYVPQITMPGGVPKFVALQPSPGARAASEWKLDMNELEKLVTKKTKILLLNNPHNPTGKVFTLNELEQIADFVRRHNLICVADEVYDFILLGRAQHIPISSLPGMFERTVTISSAGKTFSATGFKVGWAIGPAALVEKIFFVQQYLSFCVSTPLQEASAICIEHAMESSYLDDIRMMYGEKRDQLFAILSDVGLNPTDVDGGYFLLADTSSVPFTPEDPLKPRDVEFCRWLIKEIGVVAIPPSAFYSPSHKHMASNYARFCYCKRDDVIQEAGKRLLRLKDM